MPTEVIQAQPVVDEKKPVTTPVADAAAVAVPVPVPVKTDEYLAARTERLKKQHGERGARGGVQERIATLTREKAEAVEKLATVEKERQAAAPVTPVVTPVTPPAVVAVPADDKPDPRPKRDDFKDDAEFTTKIAEWVVRQQNKITATAATVAAKPAAAAAPAAEPEIKFDPANPVHVQLKTEFDGFLTAGQSFIKAHPDFTERLNAAAARGLTLDNQAQRAIIALASPEILYYLADPNNDKKAREIMAMDGVHQRVEIGLLYDKIKVNPKDFISDAPRPGTHLVNGNTRATIPVSELDTDSYLQQRRQDIKAGKRRP